MALRIKSWRWYIVGAERSNQLFDPLAEYQQIVLDAINIGRMESQVKTPQEIQKAIGQFAVKYGLLGLMTALPTTPTFMDYEAVYLPKNHFIKEETMSTKGLSASVLSVSQSGCGKAWRGIHVEHTEWPCDDGTCYDRQRKPGQTLQTLCESLFCKQTKRCVLQPAV